MSQTSPGGTHEPPRNLSALTLDEAMSLVFERLRGDDLATADAMLHRILDVAPDYPDALHYLGLLAHKAKRPDDAIALMRRSLERAPSQADWHSNLGIVLQANDDLAGAMRCFERAIELDPSHANAHNNLGVLLRVDGRHVEAEAAYRQAIAINPSHADAYHNLAILLDLTGRMQEAIVAYSRGLTLKPEYPEVRRALALAYCAIGERENAIRMCEAWLKDEPDDPAARHTLAAVSGRDVPARAADAYVQQAFDNFSVTFEAKLKRLDYRAPELVAASLAASGVAADRRLDVADAGCGTGLCAPLLRPYARRLVGVDLSEGMLRHAADKRLYDELVQAELTAYLQAHPGGFDVIVSADTFVYFGELSEVVPAAAAALRPGGVLVFTVEEWVGDDRESDESGGSAGYRLRPHGRYNHRSGYVDGLLRNAGLQVHIDRSELRKEQGLPVAGLVVRARKPVTVATPVTAQGTAGEPNA